MLAIGLNRRVNGLLDLCILLFVDFDFLLDAESRSDSDDVLNGPEAEYNGEYSTQNARNDGEKTEFVRGTVYEFRQENKAQSDS